MHLIELPGSDDISLWLAELDHPLDEPSIQSLGEEEIRRSRRFRLPQDRHRFLASHVATRQVLSRALNRKPSAIRWTASPGGKPTLADAELAFNLSHSGGWALIGLSRAGPIGVDIEMLAPISNMADLARRNFTQDEHHQFLQLPHQERLTGFLRGWTRKEACLKALGSGLSIEPHIFEAGMEATERDTHIEVSGQRCPMTVWSVPLPMTAQAAVALIPSSHQHLTL